MNHAGRPGHMLFWSRESLPSNQKNKKSTSISLLLIVVVVTYHGDQRLWHSASILCNIESYVSMPQFGSCRPLRFSSSIVYSTLTSCTPPFPYLRYHRSYRKFDFQNSINIFPISEFLHKRKTRLHSLLLIPRIPRGFSSWQDHALHEGLVRNHGFRSSFEHRIFVYFLLLRRIPSVCFDSQNCLGSEKRGSVASLLRRVSSVSSWSIVLCREESVFFVKCRGIATLRFDERRDS